MTSAPRKVFAWNCAGVSGLCESTNPHRHVSHAGSRLGHSDQMLRRRAPRPDQLGYRGAGAHPPSRDIHRKEPPNKSLELTPSMGAFQCLVTSVGIWSSIGSSWERSSARIR